MLFRAEDDGDAGCLGEFVADKGSDGGEFDDGLLGPAGLECAGAKDEGCGGEGFGECCAHLCVLEDIFGTDG
jgi:hypothetical protein